MLIEMLSVGTTSLKVAKVILECPDLLNAEKCFILQGIDEQCKKLAQEILTTHQC